jgi:hemolysin activation/secretion protein
VSARPPKQVIVRSKKHVNSSAFGAGQVKRIEGTRDRATLLKDLEAAVDASERSGPLRAEDLERSLAGLARLALPEA